ALGLPTPRYLHFPVAIDPQGEKLSKRHGAPALERANAPEAIARALAFLGQSAVLPDSAPAMLAEAARGWDLARIPRVPTLGA
ncbi:MAG TPA: tRNA glutamyl-Q(34) synthetase GluQRS, partial [Usitatibacter sp.]|nr:tRNA glutamyl-Q(34) synthetase GluQRS [Usitatibacter sp.]